MARLRRKSSALEASQQRLAGIKQFSPPPALPSGLSLMEAEARQNAVSALLSRYNGILAEADHLLNELQNAEKSVRQYDSKLLTAIGLLYGKDSSEYEMAGGTRESEAKKRESKPKPALTLG